MPSKVKFKCSNDMYLKVTGAIFSQLMQLEVTGGNNKGRLSRWQDFNLINGGSK